MIDDYDYDYYESYEPYEYYYASPQIQCIDCRHISNVDVQQKTGICKINNDPVDILCDWTCLDFRRLSNDDLKEEDNA